MSDPIAIATVRLYVLEGGRLLKVEIVPPGETVGEVAFECLATEPDEMVPAAVQAARDAVALLGRLGYAAAVWLLAGKDPGAIATAEAIEAAARSSMPGRLTLH